MRSCVLANPWITFADASGAPAIPMGVADGSGIQDSDGHVEIRVAIGEGVVVGKDNGFGAVVAEGGFVAVADGGEGVEDVGGRCNSVLEARLSACCLDRDFGVEGWWWLYLCAQRTVV